MAFFFEYSNNLIKRNSSQISKLKDELYKRGPDNFKYINEKKFFVAFSRLSIQDLHSRSNQPFTDKKNRFILLFNGEIFNLGSENLKIIEIAEMIKSLMKSRYSKDIEIKIEESSDPRSYHINSDKIKKLLNFEFKYKVKDAIKLA